MIIDGIILGTIAWLSIVFTFSHFPAFIKNFLLRHFLISDMIATAIAYAFLSSISQSIISVVGAITTGLLVNITLVISNKISPLHEVVKR
jgi:hypothetical protein